MNIKIPPEIISPLLAILFTAQARGAIDMRSLRPLLQIIVDRGYGSNIKMMLEEILDLLQRVERDEV